MKPLDLVRYFGNQEEVACHLQVTASAVNQWVANGKVPKLRQFQAQVVSRGRLRVDKKYL